MEPIDSNELRIAQPAAMPKAFVPARELPFDVSLFQKDNRIHVENGSDFTDDHYLMVHPKELLPQNERRLSAKILKYYSIPSPHFLSSPPRMHVALALAEDISISLGAKQQSLMKKWHELYLEGKTGQDQEQAEEMARRQAPFNSLVESYTKVPDIDPAGEEALKQACALYLMINEALARHGYKEEAALHVPMANADAMLVKLGQMIGFKADEFHDAAESHGLQGVADLLKLDTRTVDDIRNLVDYAADKQFSDNIFMSWMNGHADPAMHGKPVEEILMKGLTQRVAQTIQGLRTMYTGQTELPAKAQRDTDRMEAALRHLPKELAELLYLNGTEFAFADAPSVQVIDGRAPGAIAFHHSIPFEPGSPYGARQVFVASRTNQAEFDAVVTHESHHVFYPLQFNVAERQQVDALIKQGGERLNGERGLQALMRSWNEAQTDSQRSAVIAELEERFLPKGKHLSDVLGAKSMESFMRDVDDASRNLDPASNMLTRYYPNVESRTAELISRYAELKYVRMKDFPEVLDVIAPEMGKVYDEYFMRHVRSQLAELKAEQSQLPDYLQNLGYPPGNKFTMLPVAMPEQVEEFIEPMHMLSATSITMEPVEAIGHHEAIEAIERLEGKRGGFVAQLGDQSEAASLYR